MRWLLLTVSMLCGCSNLPISLPAAADERPAAKVAIADALLAYQQSKYPSLPDTLGGNSGVAPPVAPEPQGDRVQFLLFTDERGFDKRSPTCIPCWNEAAQLQQLATTEHWLIDESGRGLVHKVTVDSPVWYESATRYGITSTPTWILRVNNKTKARHAGYLTSAQVLQWYGEHVSKSYSAAGGKVFGTPGMNRALAPDWKTLPSLAFDFDSKSLKVLESRNVPANDHVSIDFQPGCVIAPSADRISLSAPYPVVKLRFGLMMDAPLKGIKLDTAGRKATFELEGFFDQTFDY